MELFKDTHFDFIGRKWWFILPSLILTFAGLASLLVKGGSRYSIDFQGGALMEVRWEGAPPIERIRAATLTTKRYEIPEEFDPDRYLAHSWGIWSSEGTPTEEVHLRFDASLARRVQEAVWHRSQRLVELPDGGVELTFTVAGIVEIRPWILSWGDGVEVLAPASLRESVALAVSRAAERYGPVAAARPGG